MNQFIFEFLKLSAILVVVACITQIINVVMKKRGFRVNCLSNHLILLLFSTILFLFGGLSVWMVKGIIFAWILLFASVQDLSTREADDFLWVMLLILSLVNFNTGSIVSMLVGALVEVAAHLLAAGQLQAEVVLKERRGNGVADRPPCALVLGGNDVNALGQRAVHGAVVTAVANAQMNHRRGRGFKVEIQGIALLGHQEAFEAAVAADKAADFRFNGADGGLVGVHEDMQALVVPAHARAAVRLIAVDVPREGVQLHFHQIRIRLGQLLGLEFTHQGIPAQFFGQLADDIYLAHWR